MNSNLPILLVLLIVLIVVVVGPVIGFVILFRRIKSPKGRVILTAGYFGIPLSALLFFGFLGSSRARVERDHSLILPASASHIRCGGPVSVTTFGDFSADASFEVLPADLPAVLSAFKWDSDIAARDIEPLSIRMRVPPQFGKPTLLRSGKSHDGNRVYLQTYDVSGGHIGVCMYTVWN